MNKDELIRATAKRTGFPIWHTQKTIDACFDTIKETVNQGEAVKLMNFGKFEKRIRKERELNNPIAKGHNVRPCNTAKFFIGKGFKELLNEPE